MPQLAGGVSKIVISRSWAAIPTWSGIRAISSSKSACLAAGLRPSKMLISMIV